MNIFTFAFSFPPRLSAESIVTYKLLKYSNNSYHVYSCDLKTSSQKDIEFETTANNIQQKSCSNPLYWPIKSIMYFGKSKKKTYYDFIMTRSMPWFGHLPGLFVKLFNKKLKWVASFSDPLANNPYYIETLKKKYMSLLKYLHPRFYEYILMRFIERLIIIYADSIIFTNKYMLEYVMKHYKDKYLEKCSVVPFGFESSVYEYNVYNSVDISTNKVTILYAGSVYGKRAPFKLVDAYKFVKSCYKQFNIEIVFLGNVSEEFKQYVFSNKLDGSILFKSMVSYEESLSFMKSADALLIYDAKFNFTKNIFLTSKLFDYLGAYKPIIAITDDVGPTAEIIYDTCNIIVEDEENSLRELLKRIYIEGVHSPNYEKYEKYNIKNTAELFDDILDSLI